MPAESRPAAIVSPACGQPPGKKWRILKSMHVASFGVVETYLTSWERKEEYVDQYQKDFIRSIQRYYCTGLPKPVSSVYSAFISVYPFGV